MSGTTPVIYSHAVGKLHPNPSAEFPAGLCTFAAARSKDWLLAAIPGTPIALQFTRQAKTRPAFTAAVTFAPSAVSLPRLHSHPSYAS